MSAFHQDQSVLFDLLIYHKYIVHSLLYRPVVLVFFLYNQQPLHHNLVQQWLQPLL